MMRDSHRWVGRCALEGADAALRPGLLEKGQFCRKKRDLESPRFEYQVQSWIGPGDSSSERWGLGVLCLGQLPGLVKLDTGNPLVSLGEVLPHRHGLR